MNQKKSCRPWHRRLSRIWPETCPKVRLKTEAKNINLWSLKTTLLRRWRRRRRRRNRASSRRSSTSSRWSISSPTFHHWISSKMSIWLILERFVFFCLLLGEQTSCTGIKLFKVAAPTLAQSVKHPELRYLIEVQRSRCEFDSQSGIGVREESQAICGSVRQTHMCALCRYTLIGLVEWKKGRKLLKLVNNPFYIKGIEVPTIIGTGTNNQRSVAKIFSDGNFCWLLARWILAVV